MQSESCLREVSGLMEREIGECEDEDVATAPV